MNNSQCMSSDLILISILIFESDLHISQNSVVD